MSKSILVTGSSGFIGFALCTFYLKQNYQVIGLDNFSTGYKQNTKHLLNQFSNQFHFFEMDVVQKWDFIQSIHPNILNNLTHVFHFASPASPKHYLNMPLETMWVNSIGLANALHFADQWKARLIFASTSEIYGDPQVTPQPENYWGYVNSFGTRSCYDEGKRFGEALIFNHNQMNKTQHGLFRLFNTYGPGMNPNDGRVIINFIQQALKNEPLIIYGDGTQTRSFCYIDDTIQAISLYAESDLSKPVNIGSDTELSISETAQIIIETLHSKSKLIYEEIPKDDPKQRKPDLNLFKHYWPQWTPEYSFKQGILKTAESIQKIID